MSSLPAAVRLSLWATAVWNRRARAEELFPRAFPDLDDVAGDHDRLTLWGELGERVLLCALPHPGDVSRLPRGDTEFVADALETQECVYVPMTGGALVVDVREYGPRDDRGWQAELRPHDCAPLPTHRLEMLDDASIERDLRSTLARCTMQLEDLDAVPWQDFGDRLRAPRRMAGEYGLPSGLPSRSARTIWTASTVGDAVDAALGAPAATGAGAHARRVEVLHELRGAADRALEDATNHAALVLAGFVPGRD